MNERTARARVTLTLEFDVPDTWGPNCTIDQVERQAKISAVGLLRRGVAISVPETNKPLAVICGEPNVTTIIVSGATS